MWGACRERGFMNAIDELVARSKDCEELRQVADFHRAHPEAIDFIVQEIQLLIDDGVTAFSFHSLWHYMRWTLRLETPSRVAAYYARIVVILHPEFNGMSQFCQSKADEVFGVRVEPTFKRRPKNYALWLQWADGRAIDDGWRPSTRHEPKPVSRGPSRHRNV